MSCVVSWGLEARKGKKIRPDFFAGKQMPLGGMISFPHGKRNRNGHKSRIHKGFLGFFTLGKEIEGRKIGIQNAVLERKEETH